MALTATMNASVKTAGGTGGPLTVIIPPQVETNGVNINMTVNLPAGFTTLAGVTGSTILGNLYTLASISGMWLIPPSGSTAANVFWGGPTTLSQVGTAPRPVYLSGGFTTTNGGVSLSAATTFQIIGF